jgi:GntR family transcriptional regulator / MocR family aminotransferase
MVPENMTPQLDGQGALFEQLARALKREILAGHYSPGTQLPATRTLATVLGVSRNTVLGAYELLCAEQLASARPGSGTHVTRIKTAPELKEAHRVVEAQSRYSARTRNLSPVTLSGVKPASRYNLQYGEPLVRPQLFASWRRKLVAAAVAGESRYPAAAGLFRLRQAIANYLLRRRGISCNPEDVIVVGGTQQALAVVARAVLDEGQSVVIEDPYYQLTQHALLAYGVRLTRVRVDADGLVAAELPKRPPRLIVVTPSHQFPSGTVMSLGRRIELLRYAAQHKCWVFEDDYDGEFQFAGRPLPALRSLDIGERVLYAGSFSKTLFPGLRLGYVVCPTALRDDIYMAKALEDLGCSSIEQTALAAFLETRMYERHLRKSLSELRSRRQALLDGLSRHLGDKIDVAAAPRGMHVVVWFRALSYATLGLLISRAAQKGLGLYSINPYYQSPPAKPGLIVGFAGLTPSELRTATAILARCYDEVVAARAPGN